MLCIQTEHNKLEVTFPLRSAGLQTAVDPSIAESHPADSQITATSNHVESHVEVLPKMSMDGLAVIYDVYPVVMRVREVPLYLLRCIRAAAEVN